MGKVFQYSVFSVQWALGRFGRFLINGEFFETAGEGKRFSGGLGSWFGAHVRRSVFSVQSPVSLVRVGLPLTEH
jgi:hypothetical protein